MCVCVCVCLFNGPLRGIWPWKGYNSRVNRSFRICQKGSNVFCVDSSGVVFVPLTGYQNNSRLSLETTGQHNPRPNKEGIALFNTECLYYVTPPKMEDACRALECSCSEFSKSVRQHRSLLLFQICTVFSLGNLQVLDKNIQVKYIFTVEFLRCLK